MTLYNNRTKTVENFIRLQDHFRKNVNFFLSQRSSSATDIFRARWQIARRNPDRLLS